MDNYEAYLIGRDLARKGIKRKSLKKRLSEFKLYATRSIQYMSILNSILIIFIFLSGLDKYGINISMKVWFVPIIIFAVFVVIIVGVIEDKLGVFEGENEMIYDRMPQIQEILGRLEKIEKKLNEK